MIKDSCSSTHACNLTTTGSPLTQVIRSRAAVFIKRMPHGVNSLCDVNKFHVITMAVVYTNTVGKERWITAKGSTAKILDGWAGEGGIVLPQGTRWP